MDIKKLQERYHPTSPGKKLHGEDDFSRFVEMRFQAMADARRDWYERTHRTYKLWDVYQPWLMEGEHFDRAVRFPTLRDAAKAIRDEIMKAPPEAVVTSEEKQNRAQALEFKTKEIKDNIYEKIVQKDCINDMIFSAIGYRRIDYYQSKSVHEDGTTKKIHWDDVGSERLDPMNVFLDEQGRNLWDPKGRDRKRDCNIKYIYPYSTFVDQFQEMEGFEIEGVEPFYIPLSGDMNYSTDRQMEERGKKGFPVVCVYEYINQEIGMTGFIANRKTIKKLDYIKNDHGRIPIVAYQFEKRPDTFYPQSLAEMIAPHIYAQDTIFNLELMGLKLDLMPATMVDADLGYNRKIHKLHPRAVWSMNVPPGKSLRDSVWPFQRAQRDANGFYNMNNYIESQLTVTSGHDRKALYLGPNELATQTAAKRQSAERAVNALVYSNELEAEAQLTELMVSDIKQYLTGKREFLDSEGNVTKKQRKVKVEGYVVKQQSNGEAQFEPSQGENSIFELTKDAVDVEVKVSVKDMRTRMMLQEAKVGRLMQFLPVATNMAQLDPKVMEKLDAIGILEQIAEAMDMDMRRTIKDVDGATYNLIQKEHIAMMLGLDVPVPDSETYEESVEHKKQHERLRYKEGKKAKGETKIWETMGVKAKKSWTNHYQATLENIRKKILPTPKTPPQDLMAAQAGVQPPEGAVAPDGKMPLPNPQLAKQDSVANAGYL